MTTFSVIMPVYGVEEFITTAIESVLNQTYTDFEFIVINDRSPDKSMEICQQFNDPRIRIINHPENRGLAGARNTGIRHAQGRYLAFLDSDDAWEPLKLERHLQHLESDSTIGISFSRSAFIDKNGSYLSTYQMPRLDHAPPEYFLCRNPIGNGSAPVIRKEVFSEIKYETDNGHADSDSYFDESLRQSEDIECWLRIRLNTAWRIEGISEPLTLYRLNAGGLSANIPKQLATWEIVLEKTRQYAPTLVEQYGRRARAYQLRYLARQAIRLGDGVMATHMFNKALHCDSGILLSEPSRTITTGTAAYLQRILPSKMFNQITPVAIAIIGKMQKLRIHAHENMNSINNDTPTDSTDRNENTSSTENTAEALR